MMQCILLHNIAVPEKKSPNYVIFKVSVDQFKGVPYSEIQVTLELFVTLGFFFVNKKL